MVEALWHATMWQQVMGTSHIIVWQSEKIANKSGEQKDYNSNKNPKTINHKSNDSLLREPYFSIT